MEALGHLRSNIPVWLKRLDELNGQIEQRQVELAQLTEPANSNNPTGRTSPPAARSIRNKGSTESLRPHDEPEAHPRESTPQPEPAPEATDAAGDQQPPTSLADPASPSALQRQTNLVRAAGQARARATLRKRQRTDSMISAEGFVPKYRTRSMIIVYYDSYVQSFFEELVKFVSASRNMMRKAKMAAKVAQIRRLAELEMPDEPEDDNATVVPSAMTSSGAIIAAAPTPLIAAAPIIAADDAPLEVGPVSSGTDADLPPLRLFSTRQMQPGSGNAMLMARSTLSRPSYARAGARGSYRPGGMSPGQSHPQDVYDDLDKGLEYVQSMCEHAAHQFLRDGDCGEEVSNIQRRLKDTNDLAEKEAERVKTSGPPDGVKPAEEELRGRSYRPQIMRKDFGSSSSKEIKVAARVDVDEGIEDMDWNTKSAQSFPSKAPA